MSGGNEVDSLLQESGAVLVRQNKHLVYRLPNGSTFTRSKTPSDCRAGLNELRDLRRALGIAGQREDPKMEQQEQRPQQHNPAAASPMAMPEPAQGQAGDDNLRSRIEAMVAREESIQERLLAEAQQVERRVHMFKALLPFAEDPSAEASLQALMPPPAPAQVEAPPPEPPQLITERVQVTRQLVFAATRTFEDTFTVNDVLALMTGNQHIDRPERLRIRLSIAQAVVSLYERGELVKEAEHFGRRQTVWRRAALDGVRSGLGREADCL